MKMTDDEAVDRLSKRMKHLGLKPELENDADEISLTREEVTANGIRLYRIIRISVAP